MNKISKKIVSLVTVAAFATTLVPAAAFAEPLGGNELGDVSLAEGQSQVVYLDSNDSAAVDLSVNVGKNPLGHYGPGQIAIWVAADSDDATSTTANEAVDVADFTYASNSAALGKKTKWSNIAWVQDQTANTKNIGVTADFDTDGKYDLYAAYYNGEGSPSALTGVKVADITVATSDAAASGSALIIDGSHDGVASIEQGKVQEFTFDVRTATGATNVNGPLVAPVYAWVENAQGQIVKNAVIANVDGDADTVGVDTEGIYTINSDVYDNDAFTVMIPTVADGYSLHAATAYPDRDNGVVGSDKEELTSVKINVTKKTFATDRIDITNVEGAENNADLADDIAGTNPATNDDGNTTYWAATMGDNVTPNSLKDYTVTGIAVDEDDIPAENETLTITTQNDNLKLNDTTVKTDADGVFEFSFKIADTGVGYITVYEPNDQEYAVLKVTQEAMAPVDIETVKDGGLMLAGTDDQYIYNQLGLLSDAVQFNIVDAYDRDATGVEVIENEQAHLNEATHDDFIEVDAPEGSDLKDNEVFLDWDPVANVYTLRYDGNNAVKDLIAGDYTVTVSLNNGKDATASFTLAEFGEAESLDIGLKASVAPWDNNTANDNAITAVDDQITLGQYVSGTVYLVDEQGLKVKAPASNLSVGVKGAAVVANSVDQNNPFGFQTFNNTPANQSVLGSVITISAYDEVNKIYTEKELTVVSNYGDETLAFDPVQGPVGENNAVEISVVDKDGKVSKVNGTVTAYVESQSNEEATVELKANETVTDGVGRLYLESDAAGTADVVVAVKATNGEIYAATLTYTFGDEAVADGRYIVMTIGSEQYLINNEIFDGSVEHLGAPYVDDAWRTMVPVRVLAETLGAEVEYADNVVTVVDGDTTVEMTIGEAAYTINGEAAEAEMDTVPVIGDGDRTYVPIRFLTNALGYEVNPLYNAEGLTSSVHFTK